MKGLSKKVKHIIRNLELVHITLGIPISLRMDDNKYAAHDKELNSLAKNFGGLVGGGGYGGGKYYDESLYFDNYEDDQNIKNAATFLKSLKKKYPKYHVDKIYVQSMGYKQEFNLKAFFKRYSR